MKSDARIAESIAVGSGAAKAAAIPTPL